MGLVVKDQWHVKPGNQITGRRGTYCFQDFSNASSDSLAWSKPLFKNPFRDFPGGTVVKNPPSNAGDMGLIPGKGTRSHMHATTKSLHATTKEPVSRN